MYLISGVLILHKAHYDIIPLLGQFYYGRECLGLYGVSVLVKVCCFDNTCMSIMYVIQNY